jgi:hypothetical protein
MVKSFKETHEKDVERLTIDRRCETVAESKETHTLKNTVNHKESTPIMMTHTGTEVAYGG